MYFSQNRLNMSLNLVDYLTIRHAKQENGETIFLLILRRLMIFFLTENAEIRRIFNISWWLQCDRFFYRFKNVFCAVCNGFKKEEVEDCEPNIVGPLNPPAFHSLFTFSGPNVADMGINRRRCAVGKVFIPVLVRHYYTFTE